MYRLLPASSSIDSKPEYGSVDKLLRRTHAPAAGGTNRKLGTCPLPVAIFALKLQCFEVTSEDASGCCAGGIGSMRTDGLSLELRLMARAPTASLISMTTPSGLGREKERCERRTIGGSAPELDARSRVRDKRVLSAVRAYGACSDVRLERREAYAGASSSNSSSSSRASSVTS